jgi:pimeloyl-ACP methyl ester carboxylesterase
VRAAARVDVASAARDLRIPTLLAWGDRDRTVPLACASRLGREIPDAKLVVGSGSHDWLVTAPDAFAATLRRFVEESVRRRGSLSLQR